MTDATERVISDLRAACTIAKAYRSVRPVARLTDRHRRLLGEVDGLELGYLSNALIYDHAMQRWSLTDRKSIVALALAGHLHIECVLGHLPGVHPISKIGARESCHYKISRKST